MMNSARSDKDDFLALLHGEITSEEYVRRLNERVRRQRAEHGYHTPTGARFYPLARRGITPREAHRRGFWDGVRSIFRWPR